MIFLYIEVITTLLVTYAEGKVDRQNIVLIIADDLGWDDVSFHGSDQIATPNIDLLAYTGIAFERYYTHCICTPSRSALLTGKFAHRTGMQGYPLTSSEDRGLPVEEKILPQYLKELGYETHLVGKWHVGDSRTEYLAINRGFDSHFGHRGGYIDYYEYTSEETWATGKVSGMSLYRNVTPAWDVEGYITDVYTAEAKSIIKSHDKSKPLFLTVAHNAPHSANDGAELQAPPDYVRAMRHVESQQRRIYAAMVKKLDESVGDIIESLLEKDILQKTVIVFISDNGGMTSGLAMNYASNWPLRGIKMTPFEGGVRVVGLLWTPNLVSSHIWKGYMHVVDWLPTLLKVAGSETPSGIDGVDLWNQIIMNSQKEDTLRNEMYEIDDYTGFASVTLGDHKLVTGVVNNNYSNHQGRDLRGIIGNVSSYEQSIRNSKLFSILDKIGISFKMNDTAKRKQVEIQCKNNDNNICYPQKDKVCLFNIKDDPCERVDLSGIYPDLVKTLMELLQKEKDKTISRTVPLYRDPRSAPKYFNYTWATFADNI